MLELILLLSEVLITIQKDAILGERIDSMMLLASEVS